jgi:hypothetical protein
MLRVITHNFLTSGTQRNTLALKKLRGGCDKYTHVSQLVEDQTMFAFCLLTIAVQGTIMALSPLSFSSIMAVKHVPPMPKDQDPRSLLAVTSGEQTQLLRGLLSHGRKPLLLV